MAARISDDWLRGGGAIPRAQRLQAYIDTQLKRRWKWGDCDCVMFAADWIQRELGRDPAKPYRGYYQDADQAGDLTKARGFTLTVSRALDEFGLERTNAPELGDVAIVTAPVYVAGRMPTVGPVMSINGGERFWILRGFSGLQWGRYAMVAAWQVR